MFGINEHVLMAFIAVSFLALFVIRTLKVNNSLNKELEDIKEEQDERYNSWVKAAERRKKLASREEKKKDTSHNYSRRHTDKVVNRDNVSESMLMHSHLLSNVKRSSKTSCVSNNDDNSDDDSSSSSSNSD